MTDLLGRVFQPGQKIVYGGRYGSTKGYTAVATIEEIREGSLSVRVIAHSGHVDGGARTVVQRPDRAVIVELPR